MALFNNTLYDLILPGLEIALPPQLILLSRSFMIVCNRGDSGIISFSCSFLDTGGSSSFAGILTSPADIELLLITGTGSVSVTVSVTTGIDSVVGAWVMDSPLLLC